MLHNRSFHILLLILAPSHPYFFNPFPFFSTDQHFCSLEEAKHF